MAAKDPMTCECCFHVAEREKAAQWPSVKVNPHTATTRKADDAYAAAVEREASARADYDAAAMARRSQEVAALESKTYDRTGRETYDPALLAGIDKLRQAEKRAYEDWQAAGQSTVEARQRAEHERQRALLAAIENGTF